MNVNLELLSGYAMTIAAFLFTLGVLVLVHEFGHFWVAKRCGVRVLKFSIGMGPRMVGVQHGETEYLISWVPFGGYVKMAGEDPDEAKTGAPDEFMSKPPRVRAAIIVAGPAMNYILAIVIYIGLFLVHGADTISTRVIGEVEPGSAAEQAGFVAGDEILTTNGEAVKDWQDFLTRLVEASPNSVPVTVQRGAATQDLAIAIPATSQTGFSLGLHPFVSAEVGELQKRGPAWRAGIRKGDVIVAVDGTPVDRWSEVARLVRQKPGVPVEVTWLRDGKTQSASITPDSEEVLGADGKIQEIGVIRIAQKLDRERLSPWDAVTMGVQRTLDATKDVFRFFGELLRARVSFDMVGGPIRIGQIAGESAAWGIQSLIGLVALLSVNLAVLNLFPIPVLDGGHLFLMAIEKVMGRPLSLRQRLVLQQIGLVVIILLMVTVTTGDIRRLFR
jgi:regulator of sigma E protease